MWYFCYTKIYFSLIYVTRFSSISYYSNVRLISKMIFENIVGCLQVCYEVMVYPHTEEKLVNKMCKDDWNKGLRWCSAKDVPLTRTNIKKTQCLSRSYSNSLATREYHRPLMINKTLRNPRKAADRSLM